MATFKVKLGQDLRRFHLSEENVTWAKLANEISTRFAVDVSKQMRVKYLDTEGELVNLSSDKELREALAAQPNVALRLEIIPGPAPSPSPVPVPVPSSKPLADALPKPSAAQAPQQAPDLHAGVVCSACASAIAGVRFKCGHCADFNLCGTCEKSTVHPESHVLLYLKKPIAPSHPAWLSGAPLLPPLAKPAPASAPVVPASPPKEAQPALSSVFIADVSIPDGTVVQAGAIFTKSWKIQNNGEQKWSASTRLQFIEGAQMTKLSSVSVPLANPNQVVEISLSFQAPQTPGRVTSFWQLSSAGKPFGCRVWCDVIVTEKESRSSLEFRETSDDEDSPVILVAPNDARYEDEMKHLLSQGFANRKKNFRLLQKHSGALDKVLQDLRLDAESEWGSS